jgi:hypothetical protein
LVDDEIGQLNGGSPIISGGAIVSGSSSAWSIFLQSLKDAASGLNMAIGRNSFTRSERHHIFSDKNKTYTPQYKEIADRYNFSLSQKENIIELISHKGRHTNAYHSFMLESLKALDTYAAGDSAEFLRGIAAIAELIVEKPWIPYTK